MFSFFRSKKDSGAEMAVIGLNNIKDAVLNNLIELEPGKIYDDIYLHVDNPNGTVRLTYLMLSPTVQNEVIARCAIILNRKENNIGVWQVDWAVDDDYKGQGFGYTVAKKAMDEFIEGMAGKTDGGFYFEAVVSIYNKPSNSIALKTLGNCKEIINVKTKEKVNSYMKFIDSVDKSFPDNFENNVLVYLKKYQAYYSAGVLIGKIDRDHKMYCPQDVSNCYLSLQGDVEEYLDELKSHSHLYKYLVKNIDKTHNQMYEEFEKQEQRSPVKNFVAIDILEKSLQNMESIRKVNINWF